VGTLFQPAGDGPFPTVLVVGGSAGREVFSGQCAALLAGHGYASLALSYFAAEGLPKNLVGIPLEYFARAIGWLPWPRWDSFCPHHGASAGTGDRRPIASEALPNSEAACFESFRHCRH
jgi:hypothetical protein